MIRKRSRSRSSSRSNSRKKSVSGNSRSSSEKPCNSKPMSKSRSSDDPGSGWRQKRLRQPEKRNGMPPHTRNGPRGSFRSTPRGRGSFGKDPYYYSESSQYRYHTTSGSGNQKESTRSYPKWENSRNCNSQADGESEHNSEDQSTECGSNVQTSLNALMEAVSQSTLNAQDRDDFLLVLFDGASKLCVSAREKAEEMVKGKMQQIKSINAELEYENGSLKDKIKVLQTKIEKLQGELGNADTRRKSLEKDLEITTKKLEASAVVQAKERGDHKRQVAELEDQLTKVEKPAPEEQHDEPPELQNYKKTCASLTRENEKITTQFRQLTDKFMDMEEEKKEQGAKIDHLQTQLSESQAARDSIEKRLEECQKSKESLEIQLESVSADLRKAQILQQSLCKREDELSKDIKENQELKSKLQDEIIKCASNKKQWEEATNRLKIKVEKDSVTKKNMEAEIKRLQAELAEAVNHTKEIDELKTEVARLKIQLDKKSNSEDKLLADKSKIEDRLVVQNNLCEILKQEKSSLQNSLEEQAKEISRLEGIIANLKKENEKAKEEYKSDLRKKIAELFSN